MWLLCVYNYSLHLTDITINTKNNQTWFHDNYAEDWNVTLVDTGENTLTGGRLKRIARYLDNGDDFCLTYGDGVADINIIDLINFHKSHGKLAPLTSVRPPARYGALKISETGLVNHFQEKPIGDDGWINGGFFVLSPKVIDRIEADSTKWELEPLVSLVNDKQLVAYKHYGFWQCMDTIRDKELLEKNFKI